MATPGNNAWAQGHITPWWGLAHRELPYVHEIFNDLASLTEWQALGYTQLRFTGDMYDMREIEPTWMAGFDEYFPWKNLSWSVYRMGPGSVLPMHSDTYAKFKEIHNLKNTASVVRTIVFLEDWNSGHYLEMNGTPVTQWRAGDWVSWNNDFPHLAANMGKTNRYTLQLTGTV